MTLILWLLVLGCKYIYYIYIYVYIYIAKHRTSISAAQAFHASLHAWILHCFEHVVHWLKHPLHACESADAEAPAHAYMHARLYIISAMPKLENKKLTREAYRRPLTIQVILGSVLRELHGILADWWSGDDNTQILFDEFCGYENSFCDIECKLPGCPVCGTKPNICPVYGITREEAEGFDLSLLPPLESGWLSDPDTYFNFGSMHVQCKHQITMTDMHAK